MNLTLVSIRFIFYVIICFHISLEASENKTYSLEALSKKVEEIKTGLRIENTEIYITGGTALSFLNHVLFDAPLKMKDLDLSFITPDISETLATKLSQKLEKTGTSRLKQVVPKPWGKGWGFFHVHNQSQMLLDLAIYPSQNLFFEQLGILNIERVKVKIFPHENLKSVAKKIKKKWDKKTSLKKISQLKNVIDPNQGFYSWRKKQPQIILMQELIDLPIVSSMRIIRSHVKIDAALSNELESTLKKNLNKQSLQFDRLRAARHFSYFFSDDRLVDELKFAEKIGVLRHLYPSFSQFVQNNSDDKLKSLFALSPEQQKQNIEKQRIIRLNKMLPQLTRNDQRLLLSELQPFYKSLSSVSSNPSHCLSLSQKGKSGKSPINIADN